MKYAFTLLSRCCRWVALSVATVVGAASSFCWAEFSGGTMGGVAGGGSGVPEPAGPRP
ncbi:MAG: hypothetical protein IT428_05905 [Planctomycetaceae bacterium]|nr:hypothetical protein [Planctomycetaceae bacterium]